MSEARTTRVESSSRPGLYHTITVENGRPSSCTCESWHFRGSCRHVGDKPSGYAGPYGYGSQSGSTSVSDHASSSLVGYLEVHHPKLVGVVRWVDQLMYNPGRTLMWTAFQAPRAAAHVADMAREGATKTWAWTQDVKEAPK